MYVEDSSVSSCCSVIALLRVTLLIAMLQSTVPSYLGRSLMQAAASPAAQKCVDEYTAIGLDGLKSKVPACAAGAASPDRATCCAQVSGVRPCSIIGNIRTSSYGDQCMLQSAWVSHDGVKCMLPCGVFLHLRSNMHPVLAMLRPSCINGDCCCGLTYVWCVCTQVRGVFNDGGPLALCELLYDTFSSLLDFCMWITAVGLHVVC